MNKELELWQFIAERLKHGQPVMLLVVAESSGSSPGRQGYKMVVGSDGELTGSIGGGVMEVNLVEQCRRILSEPPAVAGGLTSFLKPQVHQKHARNPSGIICSGRQTVVFSKVTSDNLGSVECIIDALKRNTPSTLLISESGLSSTEESVSFDVGFDKITDTHFIFQERLGCKNNLYIIGGGHCSLTLSELMSRMDFYIRLFDDRPDLNTLDKNRFAHEKHIIDGYAQIGEFIPSGANAYVVVMTLGYTSDEIVIRSLLHKDFKYFGVLGSKAKMAVLLKNLENEGFPAQRLARIHTPIGLPINSHTPEEIAVSIAAEIIAVKNSA